MKKYIENLKQKSYTEKSSFAFFASLLITGVIALVWFMTVFSNPTEYFNPKQDEVQNLANTGSLFDVFKEGVK